MIRARRFLTNVLLLVLSVVPGLAIAQDKPTSGFRADFFGQLQSVEKQILDLEQSMPQEKFGWRPMDDVRSVGEVYRHIAFGNYIILKLAGYEPPAEVGFTMDVKKWDTEMTDKTKISEALKKSYDHVRNVAGTKITDADLDKKVNLFGHEMTLRSVLITVLNHNHEHLGQSIAYARMNKVVPPWTQAEVAKEKKENKDGKN